MAAFASTPRLPTTQMQVAYSFIPAFPVLQVVTITISSVLL